MSAFEVKKALPQDATWIAQAQVLMANETENLQLNPEEVVTGVSFIFEHPDRGFYIIAKNEETDPVGCLLILKEWSDWRNGDVWWIHSVYVAPDYRKNGVFRMMFGYVEDLARKSQVRGLRLYVDKSNVNAQRVYEKLGMKKDHYELFEKMF
ncbi:GNAT family N-acetyltransferase [candidate division KSB1 bacterium]|nr:GNAT family N-acetyltransferase [candidate division KSB1 bacterium]